MSVLLEMQRRGVLSPLDRHLALGLGRMTDEADPDVLLAVALVSRATQQGHVCVDLTSFQHTPLLDADELPVLDLPLPEIEAWCDRLRASALVGDGAEPTPLVLEDPARLYLYRYAAYQRTLIEAIHTRVSVGEEIDAEVLRAGLVRMFPSVEEAPDDLQRRAAVLALLRRFSVISGGPGTGKTSTVVRILALLQEQALACGGPLRVLLLAPTGKAAQRLGESVERQLERLECAPEVAASIPSRASTIHRALGYQPRTPTRFRHGAEHPLPADVVLVDEASMVDLATMAKLVSAVHRDARLILLGDRDQLASVEAGAIFGDLCGADAAPGYSRDFVEAAVAAAGEDLPVAERSAAIQDSIVHLEHSYRYRAGSGIDRLARAVNAGDRDAALATFDVPAAGEVELLKARDEVELDRILEPVAVRGFARLGAGSVDEKFACLEELRVLCAHRRGVFGAEQLNERIEGWLRAAGVLDVEDEWYDGRPIMVTRNDYQLELFNGDVGVVARDSDGQLMAYFQSGDGLRSIVPARLPPHETVFATTVHKSQGSEFDSIVLVLPDKVSPILTRELVYTGITRAKHKVSVLAPAEVLGAACERGIERASGLREALWS